MSATVTIVCYKSKTLANEEHPLMLRVSKNRKRKYQSLGTSINPKNRKFDKNKPKTKILNIVEQENIISSNYI